MDPKVKLLRSLPLFAGCSEDELLSFAAHLDEVAFPAGRALITAGESNRTFYVLASGEAEVLVDGRHRRDLGPGDFFGEISMQDLVPATATVRTKTAVETLVMSVQQYRALRGNDAVLDRVLETLEARLAADRSAGTTG